MTVGELLTMVGRMAPDMNVYVLHEGGWCPLESRHVREHEDAEDAEKRALWVDLEA